VKILKKNIKELDRQKEENTLSHQKYIDDSKISLDSKKLQLDQKKNRKL